MRAQDTSTLHFGAVPDRAFNAELADILETIAAGGGNRHAGICYAIACMAEDRCLPTMGYDFVSSVSDGYDEFEEFDSDHGMEKDGSRWDGVFGKFREQWCREVAAALRAGTIDAVIRV